MGFWIINAEKCLVCGSIYLFKDDMCEGCYKATELRKEIEKESEEYNKFKLEGD